jgi:hypothetical protein
MAGGRLRTLEPCQSGTGWQGVSAPLWRGQTHPQDLEDGKKDC